MSPNDADWMANSVDPDQTAPLGAVWSGSALFAQAYLSENWGSLQYSMVRLHSHCSNFSLFFRVSLMFQILTVFTWNSHLSITWLKSPKYISDTPRICCNHPKIWTRWLYQRVIHPKYADGMANSVDPDQTAPLGAIWSGSALFAQAYLSENLGSLQY